VFDLDFLRLGQEIEHMVGDTTSFLHKAIKEGKRILLEGQLGALKDPDHGIYPYTTSSSPLAGFAAVGAGIPPYEINEVIAVVKAYSTCVGAGPFVTEIFGEEASELRDQKIPLFLNVFG
jgi:adenylosuccinate synthase